MEQSINQIVQDNIMPALMRWSNIGTEYLKNGTKLIGHVPHIGPKAYLHSIFPALSQFNISELEGELDIKFDSQFASFLKIMNGCHLFSMAFVINGMRFSYDRSVVDASRQPFDLRVRNLQRRPIGIPRGWLIIGGYDWGDGYDLIIDDSSQILCCERGKYNQFCRVWVDFKSMMINEVVRMSLLYDDTGKKKDQAVSTPPLDPSSPH